MSNRYSYLENNVRCYSYKLLKKSNSLQCIDTSNAILPKTGGKPVTSCCQSPHSFSFTIYYSFTTHFERKTTDTAVVTKLNTSTPYSPLPEHPPYLLASNASHHRTSKCRHKPTVKTEADKLGPPQTPATCLKTYFLCQGAYSLHC